MGMHNFRELRIWKRAMDFVKRIYDVTAEFPTDERFGLVSQLRRSAISVPSNISDGAGRGTNKQFKRFLEISMGSANEIQTQIELAYRINYLKKEIADSLLDEAFQIYNMILTFYNSLKDDE